MCVCVCVCVCVYVCIWIRYFLFETMISYIWLWSIWLWSYSDTQPMGVIHWYSDTQPMGVIHWYSDTQTNGGYSLVLWYPANGGLLIGILIPKPMGVIHWYSDTQPMGVIHWYFDAQSREYSVTIVIRLLRIWITFEYLNCFESLKLHIWFWKCLSIWTILSH